MNSQPRDFSPVNGNQSSFWHLSGPNSINIEEAWKYYSGAGVTVGINDVGFDVRDPDLKDGFISKGSERAAIQAGGDHGTRVTKIAVGSDGNGGDIGVAYEADWYAFRLDDDNFDKVDVSNNSWSATTPVASNGTGVYGVDYGRDGLGTIIVFAAGNERRYGETSNTEEVKSSYATITVAATKRSGEHAHYSEPGANTLVSAPGDFIGATNFNGTSAAAPVVSGISALMLEANPNIGWRDVQTILAATAKKTDVSDSDWMENSATNWNGGGMSFSNDYGFGVTQGSDAVFLAEAWQWQNTSETMREVRVEAGRRKNVSFVEFHVDEAAQFEQVQVGLGIRYKNWSDLSIELISPEGTVSHLLDGVPVKGGKYIDLRSNAFWGEQAEGTWKVQFSNASTDKPVKLTFWTTALTGYSSDESADDKYFMTSSFHDLVASDKTRKTLRDNDGGIDTIITASSTKKQRIDLSGETDSLFEGSVFKVASGKMFENALTGRGNDKVLGNNLDNEIWTTRGNDRIYGSEGSDTIWGGAHTDTVVYEDRSASDVTMLRVGNMTIIEKGDAVDCVAGVERFEFEDRVVEVESVAKANFYTKTGTAKADTIEGTVARDQIKSGVGHDELRGHEGGDALYGQAGHDKVFGGSGNDRIYGGFGNDILNGEDGDDRLFGHQGNDILEGGIGEDRLTGNAGNDIINGGSGDDRIFGGSGNDRLLGEGGSDIINGGSGDDRIFSGVGKDTINAGSGDDRVVMSRGLSEVTLGEGADTIIFNSGSRVKVTDFDVSEDKMTFTFGVSIPTFKKNSVNTDRGLEFDYMSFDIEFIGLSRADVTQDIFL